MNFGVTPPGICKLFETKNVQAQLHLFSLSYLNQSQRQLLLKKQSAKTNLLFPYDNYRQDMPSLLTSDYIQSSVDMQFSAGG